MLQLSCALALLLASAAAGAACSGVGAPLAPQLVELYTSEGCDSCPPAERWMSTLHRHADLIGLEFHVDYWDNADWRDPFSDHAYTLRQQALAHRANRDQVFTPQIWVDGRIWNNWPKAAPPELPAGPAPALRLSGTLGESLALAIDVEPGAAAPRRIFVALSESGLSEHVRGGENRGKTLAHDEVVRAFAGPFPAPHAALELKVPARVDRARAALVAFVDEETSGHVVQAVRIPLSDCAR